MCIEARYPGSPIRIDGLNRVLHPTWENGTDGQSANQVRRAAHLKGEDYLASSDAS